MARRFISTARFNPYTYEQLATPIQRATTILAQQAQSLNALEMQNASLEKYLDPELDVNEYTLYKQNEARLRAASDSLLRNGLNANTYNTLRDASIIYAKDIKPMQTAAANRAQYNANITDLLVKNPDAVLKSNYKHSLSEFYNGIPQTEFVSGNAIQKDVSDIMTQLANARSDVLNGRNIDKYNKIIYSLTGYTADEYKQIMQNPQSEVYAILHSVLQKHGVEDANGNNLLNNQADYDKMRQYALAGTRSLIGKTEAKVADNGYYKDVQIAQANRNYELSRSSQAFNQNMQLLGVAAQIAASTNQSIPDVMNALSNGDWDSVLSSNTNNNEKMDFDGKGQPINLTTHNKLLTEINPDVATKASIGTGHSSFVRSNVAVTFGELTAAKKENRPVNQSKCNRKYFDYLCTKVGVKNKNNITNGELNLLITEANNDYNKLNYNTFIAFKPITQSGQIQAHVGILRNYIDSIPEKVTSLWYKSNPQDPSKIDVIFNGNANDKQSFKANDLKNLMNEADMATLQVQSNLYHDYMSLIQNPNTSASEVKTAMENATALNIYALDFILDVINSQIVDDKVHTDVNFKNNNYQPSYQE